MIYAVHAGSTRCQCGLNTQSIARTGCSLVLSDLGIFYDSVIGHRVEGDIDTRARCGNS